MSSLFAIDTYQDIIKFKLNEEAGIKGAKSRLAAVAGVQPAYLSQVLNGSTHLNMDQTANLAEHWDFSDSEFEYFLTLVSLARAGSPVLKRRLNKRIQALKKAAQENPFASVSKNIDYELAATYYSDPLFSAIHMLLRIELLQKLGPLSERLSLDKDAMRALLMQMEKYGLVTHSLDRWLPVERNLHAEPDSAFATMHHRNWHIQSINHLGARTPDDLFYTAVHTLSEADFLKIKAEILNCIRKTRKIVEPSADETGAAFSLSWFRI